MEYKKYTLEPGLNEHCFINNKKYNNIALYWKFTIDSPYIKTEILTYNEHNNSVKKVRNYDSVKHYFTYDTPNLNAIQKNNLLDVFKSVDDLWSYECKNISGKIIKINFFVPENCNVELCCFDVNEP